MYDPLNAIQEELDGTYISRPSMNRRRRNQGDTSLASSSYAQSHPPGSSRRHTGMGRDKDKTGQKREKRFLREVQDELEDQRNEWKDEVDRLMMSAPTPPGSTLGRRPGSASSMEPPASPNSAVSNSYVDTSTGSPIFKAFVDVSDFPARSISVTVDKLQSKVVVSARKEGVGSTPSKGFTQKVQLPRYADEAMVRSKLSRDGIMTIEVPLMFYFPQEKKSSRSFVNEVKTRADGSKVLEILVNVGQDISPTNLKVRVNSNDELLILAERTASIRGAPMTPTSKLIKKYILPKQARMDRITSRLGNDGRLVVTVPLARGKVMLH